MTTPIIITLIVLAVIVLLILFFTGVLENAVYAIIDAVSEGE